MQDDLALLILTFHRSYHTPLAADFADRLEALCLGAEEPGHTDIDQLLDMAVGIAQRQISTYFMLFPVAEPADRVPN